MIVLGIESSCDECSLALVEDGTRIIHQVIASQVALHSKYAGVVPELASRTHLKWIAGVYNELIKESGIEQKEIEGIAVTNRPGLSGSLLVGLSFAKGVALSLNIPFVAVDHILGHLYAPHLETHIDYPYLGLLLSGGHSIIGIVHSFDAYEVLGTTIDDACGEAFDKIAKYFGWGYPGGAVIDRMSQRGDKNAYAFPDPSLHKGDHPYDVSYSGLKTAVIHQREQFQRSETPPHPEDIAASFQKTAVDMFLKRVYAAAEDTGIKKLVFGGGVSANSYLRKSIQSSNGFLTYFPSAELCTDNAAMIAGLGFHYLSAGRFSDLSAGVSARVKRFKKTYP